MKKTFLVSILIGLALSQHIFAQQITGEALYQNRCAVCHNGAMKEAPSFESLQYLSSQAIKTGVMKAQGASLKPAEVRLLANYISKIGSQAPITQKGTCAESNLGNAKTKISSWGIDLANRRFIDKNINIRPDNVAKLALKWAFAFPASTRARSQPTVAGNTLFTSDQNGNVYALDMATGCVQWTFKADDEVRSAIIIDSDQNGNAKRIFFADFKANVYALDVLSQQLLWKKRADLHPVATITGTPSLYNGRLYVPISSTEIVSAMNPAYACCTFRGAVLALDANDGHTLWKTHTTPESVPQGKTTIGTIQKGPSGAPVWSSPTIDPKRNLLYIGTGENYSRPATSTSDAILAMSLTDGQIKWTRQTVISDAWNGACTQPNSPNCPENTGPDFDFGAPPILILGKKDILLAGQKSGMVYGLNPDDGQVVWEQRVGRGGVMGGIHWGMASNNQTLYVPINDKYAWPADSAKKAQSGLHAVEVATGKILWSALETDRCNQDVKYVCGPGLSAAITLVPGLIFAGALDGLLKAYSANDGKTLWQFDTNREFVAINGGKANGGAIDSAGPVVVGNQLFVNSGYAKFGEKAGNVLLCFELTP
jgi:polyvinyl alcohol dehydrogenase (cytochrome)